MAADLIPGTFGTIHPEQVVAADPEVVIVTGVNWEAHNPGRPWVGLGPAADLDEARRKLAGLMERPACTGVKAVETGDVHAVYHVDGRVERCSRGAPHVIIDRHAN